jgi:hypothetical protein
MTLMLAFAAAGGALAILGGLVGLAQKYWRSI